MREFDERFLFHIGRGRCRIGLTVNIVFKEGLADPALSDDCSWNSWSDRDAGSTPYLQKNPAKDKSDNKPERKMAESVEDTR